MITTTDTITIANITVAFLTIAIITIAFITIAISPGPNAHTHAHNRWEAGSRFRWKI